MIPLLVSAKKWEIMDKCKLIPNSYNDGDSFHISHKGKEYIFRLYFVDTPETSLDYKNRVKEQAKYWKISTKSTTKIGEKAKKFSKDNLKGKFIVSTKWNDAKGSTKLKGNTLTSLPALIIMLVSLFVLIYILEGYIK